MSAARARIDAQVKLYHDPVGPRTWIDGTRLWYCETPAGGARRWWLVDAGKQGAAAREPLFDHAALPAAAREVAVEGTRVIVRFPANRVITPMHPMRERMRPADAMPR